MRALPCLLPALLAACSEYGVTGKPPGEAADTGAAAPDIQVSPLSVDLGAIEVGEGPAEPAPVWIRNVGAAPLHLAALVVDGPGDFTVTALATEALAPDEHTEVLVGFQPLEVGLRQARLLVESDDPDQPQVEVTLRGEGTAAFLAGWYVLDDGVAYETTSSPEHVVDHHGDEDLYWYEPSGAHGLLGGEDPATAFARMREYVISRVGSPTPVTGPFDWDESSTLATFEFATFTYFLCDFYVPADDDAALYEIRSGAVDDGIQVMVNGTILGRQRLGEAGGAWSLAEAVPGALNTLIIILVDDSQVDKYVHDLAFYRDGELVRGE